MFDIDIIIPCYGNSKLISRGVASIATQWKKEYLHVTLVNDCSPNTDCNYQDLIDRYKDEIDIQVITMPENSGQGLTRQFGIDHTTHDWFMFMDEDDQIGTGISISLFAGAVETYDLVIDQNGMIVVDEKGEPVRRKDIPKLALVSGPLFEFDDNHTHVIESYNHVWLNSKLYRREFIEKHNIRFNKPQSRHAEDYFFTSCLFHCLDFDPEYTGIMLDNNGIYYLWYPNEKSQSRIDPHYGFMLAGYTMDGSVNILKYMMDYNLNKLTKTEMVEKCLDERIINMMVYSFYTFLAFIRHVAETEYIPKLELDWILLRDACNELRKIANKNWDKYTYMHKIEEQFVVKNHSDVQYVDPWISLDDYVLKGMDEFSWSLEQLLKVKETYFWDEKGNLIPYKSIKKKDLDKKIEERQKMIEEFVKQREEFMKMQLKRQYRIEDDNDERLKELEERNKEHRIGVIGKFK